MSHSIAAIVGIVTLVLLTGPASAQVTLAVPTVDMSLKRATENGGVSSSQASGAQPAEGSAFDKIWRFASWYRNDSNPVVQRVLFSGRYQHEFATVHADEDDVSEWNVRRMRLGPRVTMFRTITLHAEVELNPQEADPLYVRFTDLYVQWTASPRVTLTAGKQGVPFTGDGATSSKELLTIDRSALTNNMWFPQEYMPGVSMAGRQAQWVYRVGVYSAGAANRELGELNGSYFTLGLLGYDFSKRLGVRQAILTANYVYQPEDANNTFTRQLEHVFSVHFEFDDEVWGVRSDVSTANGYFGQSDLWGLMVMPYFNITDKLQAVGRYTLVDSEDPNGVRLGTYENRLVTGRGDRYAELYLGANYFFYDHKLKLQTGVQFADMTDRAGDGGAYSGVAWTSGVRVGW